jgi:hypothetical protein
MTTQAINFQFGSMVFKEQIINKLLEEKAYCKKEFQKTLWFYYHHGMAQMQFIDKNSDFRETRVLYQAQGFSFAGTKDAIGITASMIGARSIKYHIYRNDNIPVDQMQQKGLPADPLSTLCGYATAYNEFVIYEINW